MMQGLIDKGYAYPVDGDVYFRVRSFPGYGKLAHRDLDDLLAGARIEVDERKADPLDFALWKAAKPGEPRWESPWGSGRPGWHIECSAMSPQILGDGIRHPRRRHRSHLPPSRERNRPERGVSRSSPFARYWMHNGLVRSTARRCRSRSATSSR